MTRLILLLSVAAVPGCACLPLPDVAALPPISISYTYRF